MSLTATDDCDVMLLEYSLNNSAIVVDGVLNRSSPPQGQETSAQWIRMHSKLYEAAVKADLNLLNDLLLSQEESGSNLLMGVTFGGDTALHIVAGSKKFGQGTIDFAHFIYDKAPCLLTGPSCLSKSQETPLHYAVKAGNPEMVSRLISLARTEGEERFNTLLRARNLHGETVLHEAVRLGHRNLVQELLTADPVLASIVDKNGASPLYMAAATNFHHIVTVFRIRSTLNESRLLYQGPKGQTALHAAVLEHTGITRELLEWDRTLTNDVDEDGRTPLHYAASAGNVKTVKLLLKYDTSSVAVYTRDNNGMFPVHIAANMGRYQVIHLLIHQFPDSDQLLDNEGQNFLHTTIKRSVNSGDYKDRRAFPYLIRHTMFERLVNSRDYKGNTPLHLAVANKKFGIVKTILSNKMVYLNFMNGDGFTSIDIAKKQAFTRGLNFFLNPEVSILHGLAWSGALLSPRCVTRDFILRKDVQNLELEKHKNIAGNISIGTVLVATVTFAAIFTMPGGYKADDHALGGTPTLSTGYAFRVFLVSDTMAFVLSMLSTICVTYAGSVNVNEQHRSFCLVWSIIMMLFATKALVCAFAFGVFVVLGRINLPMSIFVFVINFGSALLTSPPLIGVLGLAKPLVMRLGWKGLLITPLRHEANMRNLIFSDAVGLKRIPASLSIKIFRRLIRNLIFYGMIFLLALLK